MANLNDLIYGQGIVFPIKLEEGKPVVTEGSELIKHSLANLLAWDYGQRYFLGQFGTKIHNLIERPFDDVTATLIREYVIEVISIFEKRITLKSVSIEMIDEIITISLSYTIKINNTTDSFIIPFYSQIRY